MGAGWISECEHLLAEAGGRCWMLLQHSPPWNWVFHWIRSSLIGQTVWQMRPRAPPVSLLPCWGHSHPPDLPVWPPRIRTRVLMLVPRPSPTEPLPVSSWKLPFSSLFHNSSLRCLKGQRRQHPHFLPKASFTFEYKTTDSLHSKGEGWLVVCMMSSR